MSYGYGLLATSSFAAAYEGKEAIYELQIDGLPLHTLLHAYAMPPCSMANPHSGAYATYALIQWKELQTFMFKPLLVQEFSLFKNPKIFTESCFHQAPMSPRLGLCPVYMEEKFSTILEGLSHDFEILYFFNFSSDF